MKKIIIFDMDGTLINTKEDITISINHVRKINHNLDALNEQYVVNVINMPTRNLSELFYETAVYEKQDKDLFEQHYFNQCIKNLYLYDGIIELLEQLKSLHVKLNVATNAPTNFAKRMLKYLSVDNYFDTIIGADNAASKPDTKMLDIILEKYNFNKKIDKAWMVGDNLKDIQAARNKQIGSIFATWGFSLIGEADFISSHPLQILDII